MKHCMLLVCCLIIHQLLFAQGTGADLTMTSETYSDNTEITDILKFEGINYLKIKFSGQELKKKTYQLTVKEIWDGKTIAESAVFNSADTPFEQLRMVNDTVFNFTVISKLTEKNKLKMTFKLPGFSIKREFDAIESDDYRLRNVAEESGMEIGYDKKFYLLAYILPYKRDDGFKSWCDVGSSGKDIENWGERFGIKHYLLFEMKFE